MAGLMLMVLGAFGDTGLETHYLLFQNIWTFLRSRYSGFLLSQIPLNHCGSINYRNQICELSSRRDHLVPSKLTTPRENHIENI